MLKKINKAMKKRKYNTINLKYTASLEENKRNQDKIIELQDKVITIMEDNDIYQKYIIETLKKDIVKIRNKAKKEKGLK